MRIMGKNQRIHIILSALLIFICDQMLHGQGDRILRINEFLVFNETNYVDDYGVHASWIELFNPAYNSVNFAKMYVTNDPANPKKYRIPDAGNVTVLQPRSYIVLFADNEPDKGIFHVNFNIDGKGYIGIYDSDGRTLLDEIYYPLQKTDVTFGRLPDGVGEFDFLEVSTPLFTNKTEVSETSAEFFGRMDRTGFALSFIAMSVVFGALILLYFVYRFVGNLNQKKYTIKVRRPAFLGGEDEQESIEVELSGEINAAIAMALSMYVAQTHDFENTTITIKKISRPYSPWSSKIYGLRNNPNNR
jgi:Na+-transporting methylmalonyl-CoA/oxaloacetate decarboxylase gamma subunit